MPEMSNDDIVTLQRYRAFGTVDQVGKKIGDLESDNLKQRDEIRDVKAKLPKDDEVIVKKVDADELPKYRELGKPGEIKGKLEKGEKATEDLAVAQQREAATKFVRAVGLADETIETIVAIPALKGAKFEVKKGKVKDAKGAEKDGEIGYVTLAGENQKALTFADVQEQVPALKGLRAAAAGTQDRSSVGFVQQGATGTATQGGSVFEQIRKEAEGRQKKPDTVADIKPLTERLGMTPR